MNTSFEYEGTKVLTQFGQYETGAISLQFYTEIGELYDDVTVNLLSEGWLPAPDEIIVKVDEYRDGDILKTLRDNKIITSDPGIEIRYGVDRKCTAFMVELTESAYDEFVKYCS